MGFTPNAKDGSAANTALLWSPEGAVAAVYYKTKRVLAEGESFTPGTVYPTVETPRGTVGMIICFDIDFQSVADVRSASTAFRAIENRVAMVKADVAWDSVIVAPNGRVITSTAVHSERGDSALLVADIPMGPRGAPFRGLEWAVTLAMLGVLVLKKVRGPKGPLTCWVADGTRTLVRRSNRNFSMMRKLALICRFWGLEGLRRSIPGGSNRTDSASDSALAHQNRTPERRIGQPKSSTAAASSSPFAVACV